MSLLLGILSGLVMIAILVVVHESGHFLFAKLFGIGAPVFSVGIGNRLFGFVWRGTDFRVSALPIGGYVQLAGVDPFGEEDPEFALGAEDPKNFMNHPVWQRLIVMAAGPGFNLLLPVVLFSVALMVGQPTRDAVIGAVIPGSPAAALGVMAGDRLVRVGDVRVTVWDDYAAAVPDLRHGPVAVVVDRGGRELSFEFPTGALALTADGDADQPAIGMVHPRDAARVGVDDPASPAARAGLRTGDRIEAVDGAEVLTWNELIAALEGPGPHRLAVSRPAPPTDDPEAAPVEPEKLTLTLAEDGAWTPPAEDPLVHPRYGLVQVQTYIYKVVEDSPAQAAGLRHGDRIYSIDGNPVRSWSELTWLVAGTVDQAGPEATPRSLSLDVIRDGAHQQVAFTPVIKRELGEEGPRFRPIMGVYQFGNSHVSGDTLVYYYGPTRAIPMAVERTADAARQVVKVLGFLATGQLAPKESVGGPVAMMHIATASVRLGFWTWVQTMAMFSVSLAVANLLPVPVLDGGHILFYGIEAIRGRPLPLDLRERLQMIGVLVLVVVFLLVLVMDVSRLFEGLGGS